MISFLRKGSDPEDVVLVVCNFTPLPRDKYLVGVPHAGFWKEILNSDAAVYGGSNRGNSGGVESRNQACFGKKQSLQLSLPPLGAVLFRYEKPPAAAGIKTETKEYTTTGARNPSSPQDIAPQASVPHAGT